IAIVSRRLPPEQLSLALHDVGDGAGKLAATRRPHVAAAGELGDLPERPLGKSRLHESAAVVLEKGLAAVRLQQRNRNVLVGPDPDAMHAQAVGAERRERLLQILAVVLPI